MPRPRNLQPHVKLNLSLPADIHARVMLHLYSDLECKVPLGAYQSFFIERIKEFFAERSLDLAPWANTTPNCFIVRGLPTTLDVLKRTLKGEIK